MTSIATILTVLVAADVAPVGVATVIERIQLASPVEMRVELLARTIRLRSKREVAPLLRAVAGKSRHCPDVSLDGDVVVLRCTHSRFDATLADGGRALDLRVLRGMPWRDGDDGPPRVAYDPVALGLGAACPGDTTSSRGECALQAGDYDTAERQLNLGLTGPSRGHAALRLGDLWLSRNDPEKAVEFYELAGAGGPFGQLAVERRWEIFGLPDSALHVDRERLSGVLLTELELRLVRARAFHGGLGEAAHALTELIERGATPAPCSVAEEFCAQLAMVALTAEAVEDRAQGLQLFTALPDRDKLRRATELAEAAAEVSAELGAPLFGANALATTAARVDPAHLEQHLLRSAELYALAGEEAHKDVIVEFARLHLSPKALSTRRWQAVQQKLVKEAPPESKPLEAGEIAAAQAVLQKARAIGASQGSKP